MMVQERGPLTFGDLSFFWTPVGLKVTPFCVSSPIIVLTGLIKGRVGAFYMWPEIEGRQATSSPAVF